MVDKSAAPHLKLLLLTRMYCSKEAKTEVSSASLNKEVNEMRNDRINLNHKRAIAMELAQELNYLSLYKELICKISKTAD